MKTIILNASPRKNWNTAQLLEEVKKGAESIQSEVLYYDLYQLDFSGCHSCLACKWKGLEEPCKCQWKDEFSPVLEEIYQADHLVIGSPVYFMEPSSAFRAALERICFPALSYNDHSSIYKGKTDVDIFLTMGMPKELYEKTCEDKFKEEFMPFHLLNGLITVYPSYDTLQVADYSKYEMGGFSETHKREVHDSQFRTDLEQAFLTGARQNK